VGIRSTLRLVQGATALQAAETPESRRVQRGVILPGSEGTDRLSTVLVAGDLFDVKNAPVTRAEAMTVPAIARARNLLCFQLARLPLVAFRGEEALPTADQPTFLYRTNGAVAPQMRTLWTLDDMLFSGYGLWLVDRGARAKIGDGTRVPPACWEFTDDWQIKLKGPYGNTDGTDRIADADEVLLFPSPMDPLLEVAARTIRAARNLEDSWAARVRDPIPHTFIKQVEDIDLEDDDQPEVDAEGNEVPHVSEAQTLVDNYVKARRQPTGAVSFVPYGYDVQTAGDVTPDLFVEGRNAVKLDIANFVGLRASLLDASPAAASLTYTNQETGRTELNEDIAGWALGLTARLSMDDVVPNGVSVRFAPPERPAVED
jgi:hypothetical protein